MELRINGIVRESVVDGPGIRYVIFAQGCDHYCPDCHNPDTHDHFGGKKVETEKILADLKAVRLLKGVTFSGGEPFLQAKVLAFLGRKIKDVGLDLVTYTGYLFEDLLERSKQNPEYLELLQTTDLLIDGPFVLALRDLNLLYRGSTNQRIIEVPQSLKKGRAINFSGKWKA